MVEERFVGLISRTEELLSSGSNLPVEKEDEARRMAADLKQKLKALQLLFSEYELILQMLLPFFKNYAELDQTMTNLMEQYKQGNVPNNVV